MQLEGYHEEEEEREERQAQAGPIQIPADLLRGAARLKEQAAEEARQRQAARADKAQRSQAPAQEFDAETATEEQIQARLREQQDRHYLMSLLREQQNLAQMEEMRERHELDEFVGQLEHENKIKTALRQEEVDQIWAQVRERREIDERRRQFESLKAIKDMEALRLEIEKLRGQLAERRDKRHDLEKKLKPGFSLERSPGVELDDVRVEAERAAADREFGNAELLLMRRMEEKLEGLAESMERAAMATPTPVAEARQANGLPRVEEPPPGLGFEPMSVILAGKGLHRIDALGGSRSAPGAEPFARAYGSSTRSVGIARRETYGGVWSLLAGSRRGVAEIDPRSGAIVANFPLGGESKYAVNSAAPLPGGGLLATHSRGGLLRWSAPGRDAEIVSQDIRSARCLTPSFLPDGRPGGFAFAGPAGVFRVDVDGHGLQWLADCAGREPTALAVAGRYVLVGDSEGEISWVAMDEPGRMAAPFMLGRKIHCMAVFEWRSRSWLACGVRRKAEVQVAARDLAGIEPDVWLDVPERVHCLVALGPGRLAGASERFVNFWDLDGGGSRRGRVVPVLGAAPAQDIAPSPA